MINCPLKLILAFARLGQPASIERFYCSQFELEFWRDLGTVAHWDCWHSSIPVSIVFQLTIIYYQIQIHRALQSLQWHLRNYFNTNHCIVWLIGLSMRDDLSCMFTDSGLLAYNSLPSIAQLQFGIITNMKSLMLFELNNKWMLGKVCPGFTSGFSLIIYNYV